MDRQEFDIIRPYNAGEMKGALRALLSDRHFDRMCHGMAPWLPKAVRNGLFRLAFIGVKTPLDFQLRFMKPVVQYVLRKCTKGVKAEFGDLDKNGSFTFISNHRDIVLDSAILDLQLHLKGFRTTCEIAIGDNLEKPSSDIDERLTTIRNIYKDESRVRVEVYHSLTVDFAREVGASALLRGVRSVADFEYERQMADANRALAGIETVVLFTRPELSYISSSLVRDLKKHGADVSTLVAK